MNLKQAIKKYGRKHPVVAEYDDYDRYIYVNEGDDDLQKWRVRMPEPPDWDQIEGFGLKPRDQYFQREVYPSRLRLLEDNIRKEAENNRTKKTSDPEIERIIYNKFWETLEKKSRDFKDEIEWIRVQWYHRNNGKWYFIKGKPIFLNKYNWFFLNYWNMERVGLGQFRIRDQKWFHAIEYTITTTETIDYKITKKNDEIIKEVQLLDDGTPRMKDVGYRTLYGSNCLKSRRVGETSKLSCINYCIATDRVDSNTGIQGNSSETAEKIYDRIILYAFNKMSFIFRPETPNMQHGTELYFSGKNGRGGLNSRIVWATTAGKEYFDSKRMDFIHADEVGKDANGVDIIERHDVVKLCCSEGGLINGALILSSTAEEMGSDVGQNFEALSFDSMFEERMDNGQTKSGLVNIYFKTYESYAGFIDDYGYPILDTPTDDQIKSMKIIQRNENGDVMGVKEYLDNYEQNLADSGDLVKLASHQRKHPNSFRKCFALAAMGNMFNAKILQERITYLKFTKENKIRKGKFVWTGEQFNSDVEFVDDDNGNWNVSEQMPKGKASRTSFDNGIKIPAFDEGIIVGSDPYRFSKVDTKSRESKGAISVFKPYDPVIDEGKEKRDWDTNNFLASYCAREDDINAYCDEVLKACVYYNGLSYGENNLPFVPEYFTNNGYKGYLLFDINVETGAKKNNSGFNSVGNIKNKLMTLADTWINFHAHKCNHVDILQDYLLFKGPDDMKNRDIFVSSTGSLLGAVNRYREVIKKFSGLAADGVDVKGWW